MILEEDSADFDEGATKGPKALSRSRAELLPAMSDRADALLNVNLTEV
jgi:hypothetical protein